MSVWRYKAISTATSARRTGEMSAESAADVRAALRRVGLQVIDLRPVRRLRLPDATSLRPLLERWQRHLRSRRRPARAEFYDGLSTMLESGLPLAEAIETLSAVQRSRRSALRSLAGHLREQLRGGGSLSAAMADRPDWFDATEIAMVDAAQQSGELASVLRRLAERHQQAEALTQKLIGALAYPAIVTIVAIGVVIFMSTRTLPQLAGLLEEQDIAVPMLTAAVMSAGRWLAGHALTIVCLVIAAPVVWAALRMTLDRHMRTVTRRIGLDQLSRRCQPHLVRRIAVAGFCTRLAELLRTGIPLVDALRIVMPTVGRRSFQRHLHTAADAIERGSEPADALADGLWLDAEFQRLVEMGQHTGELEALLQRLADRYQRQAGRLIERLARILEPTVIVLLAAFVGLVVMAAVLPLVRLQEMI